jgi:hypothetical protein
MEIYKWKYLRLLIRRNVGFRDKGRVQNGGNRNRNSYPLEILDKETIKSWIEKYLKIKAKT